MLQQERAYPRLHWSVRTALRPLITAHGQITAFDLACSGNGGTSPSSSTSSSISSTCSNNSGGGNTSNQQKRHRRTKTNPLTNTSSSQHIEQNDETDEEPVLWGGPIARWDPDRPAVPSSRLRHRRPASTFALRRRRLRFAAAGAAAKANDQRCAETGNWTGDFAREKTFRESLCGRYSRDLSEIFVLADIQVISSQWNNCRPLDEELTIVELSWRYEKQL